MELANLKEPFPASDIEWRVQRSGVKNGKPWAMVLAYVTNRAIMDRLDDVCGPENWKNCFETGPDGGVLCGISIKCGGEWVTKYDGASNTDIESVKGGLSSAQKRAGSQWGIGRYLYNLDTGFANIDQRGRFSAKAKDEAKKDVWFKWNSPELPEWALPGLGVKDDPISKEQEANIDGWKVVAKDVTDKAEWWLRNKKGIITECGQAGAVKFHKEVIA